MRAALLAIDCLRTGDCQLEQELKKKPRRYYSRCIDECELPIVLGRVGAVGGAELEVGGLGGFGWIFGCLRAEKHLSVCDDVLLAWRADAFLAQVGLVRSSCGGEGGGI